MKKTKIPSFVTITILTTITTAFWLLFSVYRAFTKTPALDIPSQIIEPLDPTLDSNTLDNLQLRTYFEDSQIPQTILVTPTPAATETPTPTPTPTPIGSGPTASPSATLAP